MNKAKATFLALWRRNRWLTLSFVLAVIFAVFFSARSIAFFFYWQNHYQEPIEGWMTVRYIAHSYRVDPLVVHNALELPEGQPDHRMLFEIARSKGVDIDNLTEIILNKVGPAANPEANPATTAQ